MKTMRGGQSRSAHWVTRNHQNRIPKRMVYFDTESRSEIDGDIETQTWRMGCAIRWRTDLKAGDHVERQAFQSARELWEWVTDYCRPEQRTVVFAHNLGYDTRIADILGILPTLGWELEWCNLDRNVSSMTWRSERGTLVFADTFTWLPIPLGTVAGAVGLTKLGMPRDSATPEQWETYCMRDCEIGYLAVKQIVQFIKREDLGNWQPTGAGMAYAAWRHRFMTHKVLVHDDEDALAAERLAMHTGRAEAWRHGQLPRNTWTEVDMRDAYVRIAAENGLPCKLKYGGQGLSIRQYADLRRRYCVLARCDVQTEVPCVPSRSGGRIIWPIGRFTTWLWDPEIELLRSMGGSVEIQEYYVYTREPILRDWALWILSITRGAQPDVPPVVRTWVKHCGRALIGRLSLKAPSWQPFGGNPTGMVGISHETNALTGVTQRMMHIGNQTLVETDVTEGKDSLPQITGYIMSQCRVDLWSLMQAAEFGEIAHVDTDAVIVSRKGLANMKEAFGEALDAWCQVKGAWSKVVVYGPRNFRIGADRKVAGISKKATERLPNVFQGERWVGLASDIADGRHDAVTIITGRWSVSSKDPRRDDATGVPGMTQPIRLPRVQEMSSDSPMSGRVGA